MNWLPTVSLFDDASALAAALAVDAGGAFELPFPAWRPPALLIATGLRPALDAEPPGVVFVSVHRGGGRKSRRRQPLL